MPLGFGTFGAVIRIRSPFPNRRALFDIGIAGPLAGFAVAVPVLVLAAREAVFGPEAVFAGGLSFGEPPLFRWAMEALVGTPPPGTTTIIGPFGRAAWFGLLVTALNLMPIGQLDGGHVTYALFGRRAFSLSRAMWWMSLVLVVLVGPSFLLWTVLVRVLGFRHPRTLDDDAPVGRARALVGVLGLAVFLLCFTPSPFPGMTWGFVGDALRELFSYLTGR
jgi:membrane-associated protease RseP (regulator of RpoE activity)